MKNINKKNADNLLTQFAPAPVIACTMYLHYIMRYCIVILATAYFAIILAILLAKSTGFSGMMPSIIRAWV